jgi:DNA-binding MarR family transcriptional regulator
MTDIKFAQAKAGADPAEPREEVIRQAIELLFFAYRDFTAEPDAILEQYGFGRAHHRVVHFVGRNPQMTVGELLGILRITKQSLNRVLGQLLRRGFIIQHRGAQDRRQRLLELTESGRELERRLSEPQRARVAAAYRKAGGPAAEGFRKVLLAIIADATDRRRFESERPTRR